MWAKMWGNRPHAQPPAATCSTEIFQHSLPPVSLLVSTCRHPKHCKSKNCQKITGWPEKRQAAAAWGGKSDHIDGSCSRRKLHPLEVFVLPYHLSHVHIQIDADMDQYRRHRHTLCLRFFHTYLACAEIGRCQSICPEFNQLLIVWVLEWVLSLPWNQNLWYLYCF